MILYIFLDGNNIKLSIKSGRKIIAEHAWQGEYSLSEQLLPKINELLRKNKIPKEKVERIIPKVSEISGVTSTRIVQSIVKAWNIR
ncbi:MAG TPA: hypothetical protein P5548_03775 [Candidatus Moranbacteria bacterium]|nr:hypothetical protein [Candidatus Moranbacteria bacterium]HRZ33989.1 hypothetical protein [Candidatus Moranbacteria bacterium]